MRRILNLGNGGFLRYLNYIYSNFLIWNLAWRECQTLKRRMAALESQAVTTDQGDSSICVCAALAMAATEGGLLTISSFDSQWKFEKLSFSLQHSMMLASMPHKENCRRTWSTQVSGWGKKGKKHWDIYFHFQPVSEGRVPTEYNRTRFRFQDTKSLKWFFLTIGVNCSSLDDFKKSARISTGINWGGKSIIIIYDRANKW